MTFATRCSAIGVVAALVVAGCTTSDNSHLSASGPSGQGVVKPARATWSSGHFQAAIYSELLRELGYETLDESLEEVSPDLFYPAVALGKFDYWANGWFPDAEPVLKTPLVAGGTVADLVTPIGYEVASGAVQGFLIDKPTADAHAIESLQQIVESEELRNLFDINDDGVADIFGCDNGWNCAEVIEETILINGWGDRLHQIQDDYDVLFLDVVERVRSDRPTLYFAWTPNYTSAQLTPGQDVVWLGLGGESVPGQNDPTDMRIGACAVEPCRTGFTPSDIRVVANSGFLARNPAVKALFDVVEIPVEDIAEQNLEMFNGADSQPDIVRAAKNWVEDHRTRVDDWLAHARKQDDP